MPEHRIRIRGMVKGRAEGKALVCRKAFSFLGDVDMDSGEIIARGHEHEGESIAGRVMVYPETKGSSGGCLVLMSLAKVGRQPAALVLENTADPNIVEGAILAGVPLVCEPEERLTQSLVHWEALKLENEVRDQRSKRIFNFTPFVQCKPGLFYTAAFFYRFKLDFLRHRMADIIGLADSKRIVCDIRGEYTRRDNTVVTHRDTR